MLLTCICFSQKPSCSVACYKTHKAAAHPPPPNEEQSNDATRSALEAATTLRTELDAEITTEQPPSKPVFEARIPNETNTAILSSEKIDVPLSNFQPVVPSNDDIDEDFRLPDENLAKLVADPDLRRALRADQRLSDILREVYRTDRPDNARTLDDLLKADSEPFRFFAEKCLSLLETNLSDPLNSNSR